MPSTAFLSLIEPLTKRACILKEFNQTIIQSINSNNSLLNNTTNNDNYNNSYTFFDKDKLVQQYNATCKLPHGIKVSVFYDSKRSHFYLSYKLI